MRYDARSKTKDDVAYGMTGSEIAINMYDVLTL